MLDGPLIFVDIDTQRDFLEPSGALYIMGSTAIVPNLARLTEFAQSQGIPVLATACAHTPDDPEFQVFPPHCVVGTLGQERIEATAWPSSVVVAPEGRGPDTIPPHLTLEKRRYDLFTHPDADRLIALYGREEPIFVVYGVATDYCVRAAVLGLHERGHRTAVVTDAIRAVDPGAEPEVLTEFARRGATLVLTDVVCGARREDRSRGPLPG
jgi:nicotinamidase/pyrazinamidase